MAHRSVKPEKKKEIPFSQILTELLDMSKPFSPKHIARFSSLSPTDLSALKTIWPKIDPKRRINLVADLDEFADDDPTLDFDEIAAFALKDVEPVIRAMSIAMLWESENPKYIQPFMDLCAKDTDPDVRAAAATGLGKFVFLGEIEELPAEKQMLIEDFLLKILNSSEPKIIRRRALESVAYSGRDEIPQHIMTAYNSGDEEWQCSALISMGRSLDERYKDIILKNIREQNDTLRYEAIRAAGELELEDARDPLIQIIDGLRKQKEELFDSEIYQASIWALSQIGGNEVDSLLNEMLDETEDEDEIDFLENAIDNLNFNQNGGMMQLFDLENMSDEEMSDLFKSSIGDDEDDHKHAGHDQSAKPGKK